MMKKNFTLLILSMLLVTTAFSQNFIFDGTNVGTTLTESPQPSPNNNATHQTHRPGLSGGIYEYCYFGGNDNDCMQLLTVKSDYDLSKGDITIEMYFDQIEDVSQGPPLTVGDEIYFGLAPANTQNASHQNMPFDLNSNENEGFTVGFATSHTILQINNFGNGTDARHLQTQNVDNYFSNEELGWDAFQWNLLSVRYGLNSNGDLVIRHVKMNGNTILVNKTIMEADGTTPANVSKYPWLNGNMRVGVGIDWYACNLSIKQDIDTDGDGINYVDDLDDDNDGILDIIECGSLPTNIKVNNDGVISNSTLTFENNSRHGAKGDLFSFKENNGDVEIEIEGYAFANLCMRFSSLPEGGSYAFGAVLEDGTVIDNIDFYLFKNHSWHWSIYPYYPPYDGFMGSQHYHYSIYEPCPGGFANCWGNNYDSAEKHQNTGGSSQPFNSGDYYFTVPPGSCAVGTEAWADLNFILPPEVTEENQIAKIILHKEYEFPQNNETVDLQLYFHHIVCSADTDGDGIRNRLDLDSDNDGCSDALEGSANLQDTNDASSTALTDGNGSIVITNLPMPIGTVSPTTLGVPDVAGAGQGIGDSQNEETSEITITQYPQDVTVCENGMAVFSATATVSGTNSLNYRWQYSTDNGNTWTYVTGSIPGATVSGAASGTVTSGDQAQLTLTNVQIAADDTQFKIIYSRNDICGIKTATATLTVTPIPTVNTLSSSIYCNGEAGLAVTFTGTVTGTTYSWTSSEDVGFGSSGNGNIASYTATNATSAIVTATITVTPHVNGCTGESKSFTVTVNPTPTVNTAQQ